MKTILFGCLLVPAFSMNLAAHENHHDSKGGDPGAAKAKVSVTGEVVDMACYVMEGLTGPDHANCAKTCIESGLPVGIKTTEGKTYLLIGDHEPINKTLAAHAARTITVRGNVATRDGFNMIENTEIVPATPSTAYSCPMHPDVVQKSPGKCPKCGMSLKPSK